MIYAASWRILLLRPLLRVGVADRKSTQITCGYTEPEIVDGKVVDGLDCHQNLRHVDAESIAVATNRSS
jgi:hypothetical protein